MELKEYQKKGAAFLYANKKAMLIMGCRTGKTLTALSACNLIKYPVSIVAPPMTKKMWLESNDKIFSVNKRIFLSPFKKKEHRITKKSVLIVDECQLYMHDWEKHKTIINMAKKAEYCFMLTATPMINNPINLYWPLRIFGFDYSKNDFILDFMKGKKHKFYKNIVYPTGLSNIKKLKAMVNKASFYYFRKEHIVKHHFNLGIAPIPAGKELEAYSNIQRCLSIPKAERILKSPTFRMILQGNGLKIVFFRHIDAGKILFKKLNKFKKLFNKVLYMDGTINYNDRLKIIEEFQKESKAVLLLNIDSSAVGIDIQKADKVLFFERTWSPFKDYQAYMRCYGFKPDKPLTVWFYDYKDEARFLVNKKKEKLKEII